MNRNGCAALLLIGMAIGTIIWLFQRSEVIFPTGNPETFRNIASVGVAVIVGFCLFKLSQRKQERQIDTSQDHFLPALLVVAGTVAVGAWIWWDAENIFPTGRAYQLKDIVIWGITLFTLAILFRLFAFSPKRKRVQRRSTQNEPARRDPPSDNDSGQPLP